MPTARRLIDPATRDYVLSLGEYESDIGVTSKVLARIVTRRGSVVPRPSFGSLLHTIKGPIPGFERLAVRHVEDCVNDLVRAREVNRLKVEVTRNGSALELAVNYFDRRGRKQTVRHTHRLIGA